MKTIHISYGGPDRRIRDATGKVWRFEMHPYCGPAAQDTKGASQRCAGFHLCVLGMAIGGSAHAIAAELASSVLACLKARPELEAVVAY